MSGADTTREPGVAERPSSTKDQNNPRRPGSRTRLGVLLVALSAVSFGVMPIFAKLAYSEGMNPNTLLALRFSMAALGMWAIWAGACRRGERPQVTPAALLPIIAMGAIGYVGQSFSYFTAISIIPASFTGLLLYTYPVLVTVLAWLFFKEAITPRKLLALCAAATGALLVLGVANQLQGSAGKNSFASLNPEGVAWGLASAIIYSVYIIAGTRYTARVNPVYSSTIVITSAALVYLVWGVLMGKLSANFTIYGLMWAALIAVISTVIAIMTFLAGLRLVGPSKAAIISALEPATTVALAGLLLHEAISAEQAMGGALIMAAVLILQMERGMKTA